MCASCPRCSYGWNGALGGHLAVGSEDTQETSGRRLSKRRTRNDPRRGLLRVASAAWSVPPSRRSIQPSRPSRHWRFTRRRPAPRSPPAQHWRQTKPRWTTFTCTRSHGNCLAPCIWDTFLTPRTAPAAATSPATLPTPRTCPAVTRPTSPLRQATRLHRLPLTRLHHPPRRAHRPPRTRRRRRQHQHRDTRRNLRPQRHPLLPPRPHRARHLIALPRVRRFLLCRQNSSPHRITPESGRSCSHWDGWVSSCSATECGAAGAPGHHSDQRRRSCRQPPT